MNVSESEKMDAENLVEGEISVEREKPQETEENMSVENELMKDLEKTIEIEAEATEQQNFDDIKMDENLNNENLLNENEEESKIELKLETDKEQSPNYDENDEKSQISNNNKNEMENENIENIEDKVKSTEQEKEKDAENQQETKINEENSTKDKSIPTKSETPEDIINLLKSLSPEKLKEIKTKVLEISEGNTEASEIEIIKDQDDTKTQITNDKLEEIQKSEKSEQKHEENVEKVSPTTSAIADDVICLDSDDEGPSESSEKNGISIENESSVKEVLDNENQQSGKGKTSIILNGDEPIKLLKECINPECPKVPEDEYLECPTFVMSMYYVTKKPNKTQWVCSSCHSETLEIYEKLCTYMTYNKPWFKVNVPKKKDLVEIIDSDEENENNNGESKRKEIPESEMIIFDEEIEKEVEEIITEVTSKINVDFQIETDHKHLDKKMRKMNEELNDLQEKCRDLERLSYKMYNDLYSHHRPTIQRRPSLNIETVQLSESSTSQSVAPDVSITPVPSPNRASFNSVNKSIAAIQKATTTAGEEMPQVCYAIRQRGVPMPHWMPCKIIEDLSTSEEKKFKVQFSDNMANSIQIMSGKEISHPTFSDKLEIGARVIALFPRAPRKGQLSGMMQRRFLPGVIGEKLTQYNKRRYLVFCDYGQVRYCHPKEVRAIQECSEFVWNDVHQNLRQFIRDYLESKTNRSRALLNVRVNSQIMTERGGNWRKTVVQEIDCSLVRVYFVQEKISEWLYRGSKRLYTMFQQAQRGHTNTIQRRNDPSISFIEIDDDTSNDEQKGEVKKNIAKKSTSKQPNQLQYQTSASSIENQKVIILNDSKIYLEDPAKVSVVKHFTPKKDICPKKYVPHDCSEACIPPLKNNLSSFVPLAKPLLTCWERQILRHNKLRFVIYKAPCGRRLRNYLEVFKYFQLTKCFLNIENFDFDADIHVLSSLVVDQSRCPLFIPDIANGKEGMRIQCINAFDDQKPPPLEYSPHRIPMPGVNINTDPEFMSCCDCTDECYDKSKCACFQLTIQGAKYNNVMEEEPEDISYVWKRLLAAVPTGIYECNSRCKCSKRCLNKVVQHPIQVKMQLYRTKSRGWGLQSLHDIPKGTFICIYAGNLYSEKDANALCQGQDHGDEYFAELDLIENAEGRKDGFEAGVINPEEDDSEQERDSDSDYNEKDDSLDYEDGDFVSKSKTVSNREIVTRSSRTSLRGDNKSLKTSASSTPQRGNSEDSSDDEMVNMMPNTENAIAEGMRIPFRKLYGPKEKVYIMDAKKCGNVGRYFNHSCDPNLFVQSVFVDTHDLRFPWIAFFAVRAIKAGEELTWNYNYEVGSVPSKVLYCKCGAKNCRGRIL